MRRKISALIVPALAAMAALGTAIPASAALPDCTGSSGANTRLVNAATLTLSNCSFHGISFAGDGGTINNTGTLTLTNVTITDSHATATGNGGAIWNDGTVNLNNVTIQGSSSGADGGGIWTDDTMNVNGLVVGGSGASKNTAGGNGGGIWNDGTVAGSGLTVTGNTAPGAGGGGAGGGIWTDSTFDVSTATIQGNMAIGDGGGIYSDGDLILAKSTISGNQSGHDGGGIWTDAASTISATTIGSGNTATRDGGGVLNTGCGEFVLTNSNVNGNGAGRDGGGLLDLPSCNLHLANDTVSANTATRNAGGIGEIGGTLDGDTTPRTGRALAAQPAAVAIISAPNLTISGNSAGGKGGGLDSDCGGRVFLLNPTVADNTAAQGGGIWVAPGDSCVLAASVVDVSHALVARNAPTNCVGAVTEIGGVSAANLDTGNTCQFTQTSDKVNVADPGLAAAPPVDNFGPVVTQALLFGSVAIDAVPGGCPPPTTDARGVTRPQAATCDIGAYECIGAAPTMTQVSPPSGDQSGGTVITITGTNFDRPAKVSFGSAAAANVVVNSSTQITATSPPGTGQVDVTVQTCRAGGVNSFTFTTTPTLPKAGAPAPPTAPSAALLLLALLLGGPGLAILAWGRRPARAEH